MLLILTFCLFHIHRFFQIPTVITVVFICLEKGGKIEKMAIRVGKILNLARRLVFKPGLPRILLVSYSNFQLKNSNHIKIKHNNRRNYIIFLRNF